LNPGPQGYESLIKEPAHLENLLNERAAFAIVTKMRSLPNKTEDDPIIKESGRKLLLEWQ
jgi:hypothetical protein